MWPHKALHYYDPWNLIFSHVIYLFKKIPFANFFATKLWVDFFHSKNCRSGSKI
jgi:hypothetical protein